MQCPQNKIIFATEKGSIKMISDRNFKVGSLLKKKKKDFHEAFTYTVPKILHIFFYSTKYRYKNGERGVDV